MLGRLAAVAMARKGSSFRIELRPCFNPECPAPNSFAVKDCRRDGLTWVECECCSSRGPTFQWRDRTTESILAATRKAASAWNSVPRRCRLARWLRPTPARRDLEDKP